MLKLDWYLEEPIDFEQKNYMLLHYLQEVDKSFAQRKLSPFLLHTDKLISEMKDFIENESDIRKKFKTEIIGFSYRTGIIRKEIEKTQPIKEIIEIIEFSIPQLEGKVSLGYKLLSKYPQIIY